MFRFMLAGVSLLVISAHVTEASEVIAYRIPQWNTMHFSDATRAQQHFAAVRELGCEAKQNSHAGHIDVAYRAAQWQSLELANDQLADQWQAWLTGAGFETLHGHAENHIAHAHDHVGHNHAGHDHGRDEVAGVVYKMPEWKTQHFNNKVQMDEFISLMKGFGCEVRTSAHSGHLDTSIRCREWKHVELPTHQIAAVWAAWLEQNGFEVRHQH